jgi:hypothetical protein
LTTLAANGGALSAALGEDVEIERGGVVGAERLVGGETESSPW